MRTESTDNSSQPVSTVLAFHLVHPEGGRPLDVELRGRRVLGSLHDGDWVEVQGIARAVAGVMLVGLVVLFGVLLGLPAS